MRIPSHTGLPHDRFPIWRKGQERVLRDLLFSKDRFDLLCLPQGAGKTAVYMGYAGVSEGRTLILTATRALQDQNLVDYTSMGLVDVRGRSNYICDIDNTKTAGDAICTGGVWCRLMKGGCGYFDQVRTAYNGRIVQTNYRFWLHAEESGSLGEFSTIVLDEAHRAPDEISDFAAVEVRDGELKLYGLPFPSWKGEGKGRPDGWASHCLHRMDARQQDKDPGRRRRARDFQRRLARLCRLSDSDWLGSRPDRATWRWDLVDPGSLAEDLLFRGARRIILASASARKKTLGLLGVEQDVRVQEQESTFPVRRRPVYYWPVAKVGRALDGAGWEKLHSAIDEFIGPRLDRRGYIPSHSYDLAQTIYNRSRFQSRMILHKRGMDAKDVLDRFLNSKGNAILVSPAFNTGTDFAYQQCEYIIIPKVPFPDQRNPLVIARTAQDKTYGIYVAMQGLVQTVGRGMRGADDQCEAVILDSNFGWVRSAHWDFAPRHFHSAIRTIPKDGPPPPPLPSLDDQQN